MPFGLIGQDQLMKPKVELIDELIDSLWINPTSFFNNNDQNWYLLCQSLQLADSSKINQVIHSIYTNPVRQEKNKIVNATTAFDGFVGFLNKKSNNRSLRKYYRKTNSGFTNTELYPENKTVMIEGDSWFEYPLFLKEVTDQLEKDPNLAIYSLAAGGDWVANMIYGQEFKAGYQTLNPDVFIMSGGGNDMLENAGIIRFVNDKPIHELSPFLNDYRQYVILRMSHIPVPLCKENYCPPEYHSYENFLSGLQTPYY